MTNAEKIFQQMEAQRQRIQESIAQNWKPKKEVVFLPYKASCWSSMESVWKAAAEDSNYDTYVIPIPWYYRNTNMELQKEIQYEGDKFPSYVPITDFKQYDLAARHPEMIFIHNPYDHCNFTTSVAPEYYSHILKQYTEKLIYIPWFVTDEINVQDPQDGKATYNMKYYVTVPGVVHADLVIVQSEQMRRSYVEVLTRFAGEETRKIWENKIFGFGSPISEEAEGDGYDAVRISPIWEKLSN